MTFPTKQRSFSMDPNENSKTRRRIRKECKQTYGLELGTHEHILPIEIQFDIIFRLPIDSILQCKRVCKIWNRFLSGAYFADMYLRHHPRLFGNNTISGSGAGADEVGLGLLYSIRFKNDNGKVRLYYGNYDDDINMCKLINRPQINERQNKYAVVGSCNGLICLAKTDKLYYDTFYKNMSHLFNYDPAYIFNTITREGVNLPIFEQEPSSVLCGFGYDVSSNKYKVVRIYYPDNQHPTRDFFKATMVPYSGQVHVYTLGDGRGWRSKGEIKYDFRFSPISPSGILSNGSLHWLDTKDRKNQKIVAFDLADEEFCVVTPPPCFFLDNSGMLHFHLRELGGCLCVVHQVMGDEYVDIWSLKMNIEENSTSIACNMNEQEHCWSKEFSIACLVGEVFGRNAEYDPLALTKSGEVVLLCNHTILLRYDPKTTTLEKLVEYKDKDVKFFKAIPHMNSFVSLEALGEKCQKRTKYMCKR